MHDPENEAFVRRVHDRACASTAADCWACSAAPERWPP
jgi:hypothetical protein